VVETPTCHCPDQEPSQEKEEHSEAEKKRLTGQESPRSAKNFFQVPKNCQEGAKNSGCDALKTQIAIDILSNRK
jgi:hypothetical protein